MIRNDCIFQNSYRITSVCCDVLVDRLDPMELKHAKILVVDDDDIMRKFVVQLLKRLGAKDIHEEWNGSSGLAMAGNFKPDVILTDIHMKPVDGFEFMQLLRSHDNPQMRKIPVVMISADTSEETIRSSIAQHIVAYIVKPPQITTLKEKLQRALDSVEQVHR